MIGTVVIAVATKRLRDRTVALCSRISTCPKPKTAALASRLRPRNVQLGLDAVCCA
jgi:hypothetical protein